jgi:phospholipid-transporting ATPase
VEYVFSDKTGTLTKNIMDFKRLTAAGKAYDTESMTEQELARLPAVTNVDFKDR